MTRRLATILLAATLVAVVAHPASKSHAQAPMSLAEAMLSAAFDASEDAPGGDSFGPASDPSVPDEGDPVTIRRSGVVTFELPTAPTSDDLMISDELGIEVLNEGSAEFGVNQRVATMVMVELDRPPDLADNVITNISLAFGFAGQETLQSSPFANDPLLGYASVVDRGYAGDQEFTAFQQIVDGAWQPFQDPIATYGFHAASPARGLRAVPPEEAVGYVLAWLILGVPQTLGVVSSHFGIEAAEALYFALVRVTPPSSFMSADDVTSIDNVSSRVITRAEFLDRVGNGSGSAVDPPVETGEDEPTATTTTITPTTTTIAPTTTMTTATEEAAVVDPLETPTEVASTPAPGTPPPSSSSSSSSSSSTPLVVVGGLLLLMIALGLVVVFKKRHDDGSSAGAIVVDAADWRPGRRRGNQFSGRFVHKETREVVESDDPRYGPLTRALAAREPKLFPDLALPPIPEDGEVILASVSDAVNPLVGPGDSRFDEPPADEPPPTSEAGLSESGGSADEPTEDPGVPDEVDAKPTADEPEVPVEEPEQEPKAPVEVPGEVPEAEPETPVEVPEDEPEPPEVSVDGRSGEGPDDSAGAPSTSGEDAPPVDEPPPDPPPVPPADAPSDDAPNDGGSDPSPPPVLPPVPGATPPPVSPPLPPVPGATPPPVSPPLPLVPPSSPGQPSCDWELWLDGMMLKAAAPGHRTCCVYRVTIATAPAAETRQFFFRGDDDGRRQLPTAQWSSDGLGLSADVSTRSEPDEGPSRAGEWTSTEATVHDWTQFSPAGGPTPDVAVQLELSQETTVSVRLESACIGHVHEFDGEARSTTEIVAGRSCTNVVEDGRCDISLRALGTGSAKVRGDLDIDLDVDLGADLDEMDDDAPAILDPHGHRDDGTRSTSNRSDRSDTPANKIAFNWSATFKNAFSLQAAQLVPPTARDTTEEVVTGSAAASQHTLTLTGTTTARACLTGPCGCGAIRCACDPSFTLVVNDSVRELRVDGRTEQLSPPSAPGGGNWTAR